MDDRHQSSGNYRYGFQGQEQDDEVKGEGNSYSATFWQYDSRLGKRWEQDPIVKVHESPYATFSNNPVWFADPNGADTIHVTQTRLNDNSDIIITNIDKVDMSDENILYVRQWDVDGNLIHEGNDFMPGSPEYYYAHANIKVWVGAKADPYWRGKTKTVEAWQAWENVAGKDRYFVVEWVFDANGLPVYKPRANKNIKPQQDWKKMNIRPRSYLSFEVLFENAQYDYNSSDITNWIATNNVVNYFKNKLSQYEGGDNSAVIPQNGAETVWNKPIAMTGKNFVVVGYHSPPAGSAVGNTALALNRAQNVANAININSSNYVLNASGGEKTRSAMIYLLYTDQANGFINGINYVPPSIGE